MIGAPVFFQRVYFGSPLSWSRLCNFNAEASISEGERLFLTGQDCIDGIVAVLKLDICATGNMRHVVVDCYRNKW